MKWNNQKRKKIVLAQTDRKQHVSIHRFSCIFTLNYNLTKTLLFLFLFKILNLFNVIVLFFWFSACRCVRTLVGDPLQKFYISCLLLFISQKQGCEFLLQSAPSCRVWFSAFNCFSPLQKNTPDSPIRSSESTSCHLKTLKQNFLILFREDGLTAGFRNATVQHPEITWSLTKRFPLNLMRLKNPWNPSLFN